MKLYVELSLNDAEGNRLKRIASRDEIWFARPEKLTAADETAFSEAEVAFGNCSPRWLETAQKLRWIQLPSVGIDDYRSLDWDVLGRRVTCTNLRGMFAEPVAETCLAGILALYRGLDRLVTLQAHRSWQKLELRTRLKLLQGADVVMVGAGTIARRLTELLEPFGCRVTSFGRTSGDVHTLEELDEVLARADVVCSMLPDTEATRNLFDAARFALLKEGAVFVNVGRGSVVDETALVEALRSRRLSGAIIDVTRQEPLLQDHPLWTCSNAILTQHTAGGSNEENNRAITFFEENLARYRRGEPLLNVVDWQKGY
jgi:phosphoglycerate dehydrogenase-like enzyme